LGEGINPDMALTPSSIRWDSNASPFTHESIR